MAECSTSEFCTHRRPTLTLLHLFTALFRKEIFTHSPGYLQGYSTIVKSLQLQGYYNYCIARYWLYYYYSEWWKMSFRNRSVNKCRRVNFGILCSKRSLDSYRFCWSFYHMIWIICFWQDPFEISGYTRDFSQYYSLGPMFQLFLSTLLQM